MTLPKLRNKILACMFGMLAGASFVSLAQNAGPQITLYGKGGTITTDEVPVYATTTGALARQTKKQLQVASCQGCTQYALGGAIYYVFTQTGVTHTFTSPVATNVSVLVVGGGGGGGGYHSGGGGGGGGSVIWDPSEAVTTTPVNIVVGAGGLAGNQNNTAVTTHGVAAGNGGSGNTSSFGAVQALGGGGGLRGEQGAGNAPAAPTPLGGGGGGAGSSTTGTRNGAGNVNNNGAAGGNSAPGTGTAGDKAGGGGGGGGPTATGGRAGTATSGGHGGDGSDMSANVGNVVGERGYFGGGGGGGKRTGEIAGTGGLGGGGDAVQAAAGGAGVANTGGGGAGGGNATAGANSVGGAGGSGIVIVKFTPQATGPDREVHVFNATGTFKPPEGLSSIEILVVGAGGAGGSTSTNANSAGAGGGGGGQYIYNASYPVNSATTYNVNVGTGGAGNGAQSDFHTIAALTAIGGRMGATNPAGAAVAGGTGGGSGGGGARGGAGGNAGAAQSTAGGGSSNGVATPGGGGGGGGAGSGAATALGGTTAGGNGGWGIMETISGTAESYGGGGGGGGYFSTLINTVNPMTIPGGNAGPGGGGLGGNATTALVRGNGTAGTTGTSANRGGGGGGASGSSGDTGTDYTGGAGGSGVVIISYTAPKLTYVIHTFTRAHELSPDTEDDTFRPPPGITSVEVLVVGGGGGGGSATNLQPTGAGGGGAGGLIHNAAFSITAGAAIPITIGGGGAGGALGPNNGVTGGDSVFSSLTAKGGGGGAGITAASGIGAGNGLPGGSGGGGRGSLTSGGASNQVGGSGNPGGNFAPGQSGDGASGGGGAGGPGLDDLVLSGAADLATNGGPGVSNAIQDIDTPKFYAGGGGGGQGNATSTATTGGSSVGGSGGASFPASTPPTSPPHTGEDARGGGGGGGNGNFAGAAGGDGVVIVRYRPPTMQIVTQHANATAHDTGAALPSMVVRIRNANGTAISPQVQVTAGIESSSVGTATLGPGSPPFNVTTVGGDATFTGLTLSGTATSTVTLDFNVANTTPIPAETVSNTIALQTFHVEINHTLTGGAICSPSIAVTLSVRRPNGTAVDYFTGNVTIQTSSGDYVPTAGLAGTGDNNGTAVYSFLDGDNGVKILGFKPDSPSTYTFNTVGYPLENYGAGLLVRDCEFRIATNLNATVCNDASVTLSVNQTNGTLVSDYVGQVQLSTVSSPGPNQGSWGIGTGQGSLIPGGGNGGALYTFGGTNDGGDAILSFRHPATGSVNINVESIGGAYSDDNNLFDQGYTVDACTNSAQPFTKICSDTATTASVSAVQLPPTGTNRLALVTVHRSGAAGTLPANESMTFGGIPMQLLHEREIETGTGGGGNVDVQVQIYGLLEAQLATLGTAPYAVTPQNIGGQRLCVLLYQNMSQTAFPLPAGQVSGLVENNATTADVQSTVSAPALGSLVVSATSARLGTAGVRTWSTPDLSERLYTNANNSLLAWGVSAGIKANGSVTVTETHNSTSNRRVHALVTIGPAPAQLASFRLTHSGKGATCTDWNEVTLTAVDQFGATLTTYNQTVTLTSGGAGDWYDYADGVDGAVGLLSNVGGTGQATYKFETGDQGTAKLYYRHNTPTTANFTATAGSIVLGSASAMSFANCKFRISHELTDGSVCQPNLVTIGVYDAAGVKVEKYHGLVTIRSNVTAAPGNGDWAAYTTNNTVTDSVPGDGELVYQFVDADAGDIVLAFYKAGTVQNTVNFGVTVAGGGVTVDSPGVHDPDLVLRVCSFRIDHDDDLDANAEVCMAEEITFTVVNSNGTIQVRYAGTPTITTFPAAGTWTAAPAIAGRLTDTTPGDGSASFEFDPLQDPVPGTVKLKLMYQNVVPIESEVNINISGGGTFLEDPAYDMKIDEVKSCKFRIALSNNGLATSCTMSTVTLGVYNNAGELAEEYAGLVSLSTNLGQGEWVNDNGSEGELEEDSSLTNGLAEYEFVAGDGGEVQLSFASVPLTEDGAPLNFNATVVNGAITVDPADGPDIDEDPGDYDPNLTITGCLPLVRQTACYANQSQPNAITLRSSVDARHARMVLFYVASNSTTDVTAVTIEDAIPASPNPVTWLRTQNAAFTSGTTKLHVYGILDANLPAAAGSYDVAFTGSDNSPAMCIVYLEGVGQVFPTDPDTLNGSSVQSPTELIQTPLTTTKNNSIVIGVVANGSGTATYESTTLDSGVLWQNNTYDPGGGDWAGFFDYQLTPGPVVASASDPDFTPNRQALIALAIQPFVNNDPAATTYNPVKLFATYSGNINYRAIGNTLRTDSNTAFSGVNACQMRYSSTDTLKLPAGAKVRAAYLYWAGSGYEDDLDDTVYFGNYHQEEPEPVLEYPEDPPMDGRALAEPTGRFYIAANQVYNPDEPAVPEGFWAAYKDLTGTLFPAYPAPITATDYIFKFSNMVARTDPPWFNFRTCLGGWSLVVIYEHSSEPLNTINLFHGFQPFFHSAFTLVPRNFRMASPNIPTGKPHAQVTHITFEGDPDITDPAEVLELQTTPTALNFAPLSDAQNPGTTVSPANEENNQYNSTESMPDYDPFTLLYQGTSTWDLDTHGIDIDTFYVKGAQGPPVLPATTPPADPLNPFGQAESEQITTRYSTGGDIVLLLGEIISVTNAPIADLKVTATSSGTWRVGTTGQYTYTVTNNGDGSTAGGFANGDVILTGNLHAGITIATISAPGWTCHIHTSNDKFTCIYRINTTWTGGAVNYQLKKGESISLQVNVTLANDTIFQALNNPVDTVARIAHVGNYLTCPSLLGANIGVQPNPNPTGGCSKPPQFDNVNDLNKFLVDIDELFDVQPNQASLNPTNNNVFKHTRNVLGYATDLGVVKSLQGALQAGGIGTYHITVTNYGPDATTRPIRITDQLDPRLTYVSGIGTGWDCSTTVGHAVECFHAGVVANGGATQPLELKVQLGPTIFENTFLDNTANVYPGQYNIDPLTGDVGPDSSLTSNNVLGGVASATDKFLISASADNTTLGTYTFNEGDLVLYDPATGVATPFLLESSFLPTTNLGNIDALHVLPDGRILLSTANDGSTIASRGTDGVTIVNVAFDAEDVVMYDPIKKTATLIFDGSLIFAAGSLATADIDSLHVNYNNSPNPADWDMIFSTTADAEIDNQPFQNNDIVKYAIGPDPGGTGGAFSILKDGASNALFGNANGDISALYVRYDNPNKYILSTNNETATVGVVGDPLLFQRGELVEIDLTATPVTTPMLCNSANPCTTGSPAFPADFTPTGTYPAGAHLDAAHMIETHYFGHFAVSITPGNACTQTTVTISKHAPPAHLNDSNYKGAVLITTNLNSGVGRWEAAPDSKGVLTTSGFGLVAGQAIYEFENGLSGDQGDVVLYITQTGVKPGFEVSVTNFIVNAEAEDETENIAPGAVDITYIDEFSGLSYGLDDGTAGFASDWSEINDDNDNPGAGKIQIVGGELRFNNSGGGAGPALQRSIDFTAFPHTVTPKLFFNYNITGSPSNVPVFVVETSNGDNNFTELTRIEGSTGSGDMGGGINIPAGLLTSATATIRFRIASGYSGNLSEYMFIDNVRVDTETSQCGTGDPVAHYDISVNNEFSATCLVSLVTVSPHSSSHAITRPGVGRSISLTTTTNKGRWGPPTNGTGAFSALSANGQATYVYDFGEDEITFPFYYTNITGTSELVSFALSDSAVPSKVNQTTGGETDSVTVALTALQFWNESADSPNFATLVAGMPSNIYRPAEVLTIQAVRASMTDPAVCEDAFGEESVAIDLAVECIDPIGCGGPGYQMAVTNSNNVTVNVPPTPDNGGLDGVTDGGYVTVTLPFTKADFGPGSSSSFSRARLILNYNDAGKVQLHARHKLIVENDIGNPLDSTDVMLGSGVPFVVRPFAYKIDFLNSDRELQYDYDDNDYDDVLSYAADANSPHVIAKAGEGFSTTVSAVAWQPGDDDVTDSETGEVANDGIPNIGARLFDNPITPNYGNEIEASEAEDDIVITPSLIAGGAGGTTLGYLKNNLDYIDFDNGSYNRTIAYSEVGIINLTATLVPANTNGYLDGGEGITGTAYNVGRFTPQRYDVITSTLTPRALFPAGEDPSSFNYMGEDFGVTFELEARNADDEPTLNYQGLFAKLLPADIDFFAVKDRSGSLTPAENDDIDYSSRLAPGASNALHLMTPFSEGRGTLDGNLRFVRQPGGAEDGPYEGITIALRALDGDNVPDGSRNVDDDDGNPLPETFLYNLIDTAGEMTFRYGRLRLENAYGPDVPDMYDDDDNVNTPDIPRGRDVQVMLTAEYWNGTQFVNNDEDEHTPYASTALIFVPGSYNLDELDTDQDNLDAGEAAITTGVSGVLHQGGTFLARASLNDTPLYLRAPLVIDNQGSVLVELNLTTAGLAFLSYDWRTNPELNDETLDGVYTDNPRARVEFGTYRGNDRIINWQEIFE